MKRNRCVYVCPSYLKRKKNEKKNAKLTNMKESNICEREMIIMKGKQKGEEVHAQLKKSL